jgi:iron complex outermembrane receptor protein
VAVALSFGAAGQALAQEANVVEEIVVTGSFIRGTPEDAALPVDVISQEDLQKQGSPSTVELMKSLTVSNGVLGDTNQFDSRAQGAEGAATVNLRGLGASRTLVLMNGRRMVNAPIGAGAVDANLIPSAAIGRVEVLKDGAAATYGSDAIGGVVNFITRTNLNGLEVSGSYKFIDGSDGDYDGSIAWGWVGDSANVLLTAGYQHRSKLPIKERDFALRDYFENPEGGWSTGGNPSTFLPLFTTAAGGFAPAAGLQRDASCVPLGGTATFSGTTPVCAWNFTPYDNLVEREERVQLYGEVNADLNDTTRLHVEAFWSQTDTPEWDTSPSYLALQAPTASTNPAAASGLSAGYFVPSTNPGFQLYAAQNPGAIPGIATGAYFPGVLFRPLALAGNPLWGDGSSTGSRKFEAYRVSASIKGDLGIGGIRYDAGLTYMVDNLERVGYDTVVSRFQLALRGLGGPNCNYQTGTPGQGGCMWWNPFGNAIPSNYQTGAVNPQHSAAVANSPDLLSWFFQPTAADLTTRIFVADLVFDGETPIELGGGNIAWAVGGQFRRGYFEGKYDGLSSLESTPCIDTPVTGSTNCTVRNGPFMFLGGATPSDLEGDVYAVFGEVSLPFTDSFQAQLAARYEDYGDNGGSTFDPKLSLRWQINDMFAWRGSVSTTFRAPPLTALDPGQVTSLQFLGGAFRAVDILGNPDLEPESAFTWSTGLIVDAGPFRGSVDYWDFDFENPIVTEPVGGMFAAMFPTGAGTGNCGNPAFAALQQRFVFQGACGVSTLSRIVTNTINGPGTKTSGIDVLGSLDFPDTWGGDLEFGGSMTYVLKYDVDATTVEGIEVQPALEGVNKLNYQTQIVPVPQWKAQFYGEYSTGPHNLRLTVNYIDSYIDQRTSPFAPNLLATSTGATVLKSNEGRKIDGWMTANLTYRVLLPWDTTAVVSIDNLTDNDPSYARLDLNYDPFTGNPLGRTYKLSLTKKF